MLCHSSHDIYMWRHISHFGNLMSAGHVKNMETRTREEQHTFIHFMGSEGKKPVDVHHRMKQQHGYRRVSLSRFMNGTGSLKMGCQIWCVHLCSGQPYIMKGLMLMLQWNEQFWKTSG